MYLTWFHPGPNFGKKLEVRFLKLGKMLMGKLHLEKLYSRKTHYYYRLFNSRMFKLQKNKNTLKES